MKVYKPVSDREVARRLSVTTINSAYYYLPIIQEIFGLGLVICERTDRPQGEWIPCSERPPEEDGDYLATLHCKWPNREYKTVEVEEFRNGKFDENLYMKVVAWMPLPEPYMKGADDEVL